MKVFTNGCFDVLHRGHLEMLEYCRHRAGSSDKGIPISMRGEVIVGLNSDASVKRLKGETRPINNEKDRKYFLEGFSCVDRVIIFETDTPRKLIELMKPDLIVKSTSSVFESEETDGYDVWLFKHLEKYSTTNIIKNNLHKLPSEGSEGGHY